VTNLDSCDNGDKRFYKLAQQGLYAPESVGILDSTTSIISRSSSTSVQETQDALWEASGLDTVTGDWDRFLVGTELQQDWNFLPEIMTAPT